jgi:prevent-host-death family protein
MEVSIGQVKRDISVLINRVAYGGERIILTSRGKPKAVLISMDDYERLASADNGGATRQLDAWFEASDRLASRILDKNKGKSIDVDRILQEARIDLEARHDYLRSD